MAKRNASAWPPDLEDHPAIEYDGNTYIGTADALIEAGVLRQQDVPGNPDCRQKWGHWDLRNGVRFGAMRLGSRIFVQIYPDVPSGWLEERRRRAAG